VYDEPKGNDDEVSVSDGGDDDDDERRRKKKKSRVWIKRRLKKKDLVRELTIWRQRTMKVERKKEICLKKEWKHLKMITMKKCRDCDDESRCDRESVCGEKKTRMRQHERAATQWPEAHLSFPAEQCKPLCEKTPEWMAKKKKKNNK
jgi:hypothetical protein